MSDLSRILEPELMDSAEDAHEYDSMNHAEVNAQFVTDLLNDMTGWPLKRPVESDLDEFDVLDLGAGTAQIAIELGHRESRARITAVDAAESMLTLARKNIAAAGLGDRIELVHADAKELPFHDGVFDVVSSNSIVHHIPQPCDVLSEAIRIAAPGGLLFHRDLARPNNERALEHLVQTYAGNSNAYQRRLFADSLRAALTVEEMRQLVTSFGFTPDTVRMTSDRHWTWSARRS
jgi:ubiquinone/menaquinone biosynthesis C-methylase UbiE